jgi:hypothetical protein
MMRVALTDADDARLCRLAACAGVDPDGYVNSLILTGRVVPDLGWWGRWTMRRFLRNPSAFVVDLDWRDGLWVVTRIKRG